MNFSILNLVLLALLYFPIRLAFRLRANIKAARASGLPYIVTPVHVFDTPWLIASPLVIPFLRKTIPKRWQGIVLDLMHPEWMWRNKYIPFGKGPNGMGADTFLIVTPTKISMMTADPTVVSQITTRRNDFPKPIRMYGGIDIYGKNVVTTEGTTWRRHRKSTIPPFGEKNNRLVWSETIFQTEEMINHWHVQSQKKENKQIDGNQKASKSISAIVTDLGHDTMRLSLYVISKAGFDVRCDWPERATSDDAQDGVMSSTYVPKGFSLSYVDSLESLLHRLLILIMLPKSLLVWLPFSFTKLAYTSFEQWGKYMTEIYNKKKLEIEQSKTPEDEGMDIMGAMIRTSGQIPDTVNYGKPDAGLTKEEILGNSFVLFLAGHETAANTIHFSMIYLATKPEIQRKLHADLDEVLGGRKTSEWDYDTDLPKLFSGMSGAIMNEQLRLIPPITTIPKCTLPGSIQTLNANGKQVTVPEDTFVGLIAPGVHQNPKFWPHEKDDSTELGTDLWDFIPDRWFKKDDSDEALETQLSKVTNDGLGVDESPDTAASFFRPAKGAYIPFSEGPRACLGRRFAQVEILAALAVIFQHYSVELAVDEYASEAEVSKMDVEAKKAVWNKAKGEVERKLADEMGSIITIQLRGKPIAMRLVPRGQELFNF